MIYDATVGGRSVRAEVRAGADGPLHGCVSTAAP
jgi:hypothetical protein